jgi:hypothetical protein
MATSVLTSAPIRELVETLGQSLPAAAFHNLLFAAGLELPASPFAPNRAGAFV